MIDGNGKKESRRLRHAKAKLKLAEKQLRRAERGCAFWRRRIADLRYERACERQNTLFPTVY